MRYDVIHRNRWFLIIVGVPTLLAILYYGVVASDQFVSESRFVVKNQSEKQTSMSSIASLIQTTGLSSGQEQTNEVMDYLRSRNALSDLQKRYDVKGAFSTNAADFLARYPFLGFGDHFENLYRYYSKKVDVRLDTQTNVAVLEVSAFTSKDAERINARLLDQGEQLVNRLNVKANQNSISEARQRVTVAEDRVRRARLAMAKYRNQEDLLDPSKQAAAVLDISNKFVAQQAALQAQLELMQKLTPDNPSITSLREQISAIGRQIADQNGKAVGNRGAIASKLADFENLQLEQEFASQALVATNASLEQSEADAARQQFYLERIVEPNTPDVAELPHRFTQIATVFAVSICLYLIGWMLVVGIIEHAPED